MSFAKNKLLALILSIVVIGGVGAYLFFGMRVPAHAAWIPASALSDHQPAVGDNEWFWMKNDTIYCEGNPIGEADIASFAASSISAYAKDKNNVYMCANVVANFDPATFTVLDANYGKDATHVVYGGYYLVPGADAATFTVILGSGYGKDRQHVYDAWRELPGADPATFEVVPPNAARDKNSIYISDKVFGPASLIADNAQYAQALPAACNPAGADPISPQVFPGAFSEDENVIGYMSASRICVIDKKSGTAQSFPYGFSDSASLSADGSKVLFYKYIKGDGGGEGAQSCADCGEYSIDRATGEVEKAQ